MKILYSSCHSSLEYQELRILTELDQYFPDDKLDIEVFSLGAYSNPTQNADYLRSVIPKGKFYPELYAVAMQCSSLDIHEELVNWADVWFTMHNSLIPGQKKQQQWLANNFYKFHSKGKKVVYRSIGQSTPQIESELKEYTDKGLSIMRMSPLERFIPNYVKEKAIIRFSEDKEEFKDWNGERKQVITIAQSFKKRGDHLGYDIFERVTNGFQRKVFGTENEDLGEINGGRPSYEELKRKLRDSRIYFYTGTRPSPYTMSFVEVFLTGIPIVAIGAKLREDNKKPYDWKNYEIPDLIQNGINGYISDNIDELRGYIQLLMDDYETAKRIGDAGRQSAIKHFDKVMVMNQWKNFLKSL